jgi:two-component system response regulator FixJ
MPPDTPIYIIDDEPEMCRSLSLLLATGGIPARTFGSGDMFLDLLDHLPSGVVICDVTMPGTSGIELTREMVRRGRSDPIIIIAGHADVPLAVDAMKAGALDFLEKPFSADTVMQAVSAAKLFAQGHGLSAAATSLSKRERQVFELIMAGTTSKEAARVLGISPRTVETYRGQLMSKTKSSSTAQLIRIGLEAGIAPASLPPQLFLTQR